MFCASARRCALKKFPITPADIIPAHGDSLENIEPIVEPSATPEEEWLNLKQFLYELLQTIALAVLLYLAINAMSARVRVDGSSMQPTLQNGEYVLVSKISYKLSQPQYGDIIVFKFPGETPEQDLIKRIIGVPGDIVDAVNGVIKVNGIPLTEPYTAEAPFYNNHWEVPEGMLFVLGDNRNDSSDSHAWGFLPIENVIGKAIVIYWPPREWKLINHVEMQTQLSEPVATATSQYK